MLANKQSIKTIGLQKYLESTKENHNDYSYTDFIKLYDLKVNMANIAKAFGVDYRTIKYWITIHEEENKK